MQTMSVVHRAYDYSSFNAFYNSTLLNYRCVPDFWVKDFETGNCLADGKILNELDKSSQDHNQFDITAYCAEFPKKEWYYNIDQSDPECTSKTDHSIASLCDYASYSTGKTLKDGGVCAWRQKYEVIGLNVSDIMPFQKATLTRVCTKRYLIQGVRLEDYAYFYYKDRYRKFCNINEKSSDFGYEFNSNTMENKGVKCENGFEVLYKTRDIRNHYPQIVEHIDDFAGNQFKI